MVKLHSKALPADSGVMSTAVFVQRLFGRIAEGYLEFSYQAAVDRMLDPLRYTAPDGSVHAAATAVGWRRLPLGSFDAAMPQTHDLNRPGYSLAFGVGVRRQPVEAGWRMNGAGQQIWQPYPPGEEAAVCTISALWVDVGVEEDWVVPRQRLEALQPSLLVKTVDGYQGYWLLAAPLAVTDTNRGELKHTLKGLARAAGGTAAAVDLAQCLRLPGFIHYRPGDLSRVCTVIAARNERYRYVDFVRAYAAPTAQGGRQAAAAPPADELDVEAPTGVRYAHAAGVPMSWLVAIDQALGRQGRARDFARLWFSALRQGLLDPQDVTSRRLLAARDALAIPLGENALRAALKRSEDLLWQMKPSDTGEP